MVSVRQHRLRWKATVRVPKALEGHEGTKFRYRNLKATGRKAAQLEAQVWETSLRVEWAKLSGQHAPTLETLREIYQSARSRAESGELLLFTPDVEDPLEAGIEFELGRIGHRRDPPPLSLPAASRRCERRHGSRAVQIDARAVRQSVRSGQSSWSLLSLEFIPCPGPKSETNV